MTQSLNWHVQRRASTERQVPMELPHGASPPVDITLQRHHEGRELVSRLVWYCFCYSLLCTVRHNQPEEGAPPKRTREHRHMWYSSLLSPATAAAASSNAALAQLILGVTTQRIMYSMQFKPYTTLAVPLASIAQHMWMSITLHTGLKVQGFSTRQLSAYFFHPFLVVIDSNFVPVINSLVRQLLVLPSMTVMGKAPAANSLLLLGLGPRNHSQALAGSPRTTCSPGTSAAFHLPHSTIRISHLQGTVGA
ncbi:hypothetical protein COO60DRAFT_1464779 [Scenedesmus sp. NREL 46B-D3]|nr:hypothetical protein COO60DRAFT_1464779 [Scenedesmus sp. NREL 46B-D3]